ncbi:hypothetical protein QUB56_24080 [Microcoleus sp. AR_TQ3_B6]|uniref:hypothetical protein n=1 Tax=Microcoleus sp. AR_TQ3_B6 TaxID=3055284 RepID=UPI002FD31E53
MPSYTQYMFDGFNENLLKVKINENEYNIAETVIHIINAYVEAKRDSLEKFIQICKDAQTLTEVQSENL